MKYKGLKKLCAKEGCTRERRTKGRYCKDCHAAAMREARRESKRAKPEEKVKRLVTTEVCGRGGMTAEMREKIAALAQDVARRIEEMIAERKFTLLYVPHDGLRFDGGEFLDGLGNRINWDRTIPVFSSHAKATAERDRLLEQHPFEYSNGRIVVLSIELRDGPRRIEELKDEGTVGMRGTECGRRG